MYIQSFHIDGFGIFSNINVDNISPNLTIFLGNNEAGKSTCLNFFRTMLTGYPSAQSKELQFKPLNQGDSGGTLTLSTKQYGLINLTRRPHKGGDVKLYSADGSSLDLSILEHLMGGITRDVYRNIFGFSLSELQTFDSLNSDNVKHALYGASFGMGLRSPSQVFKDIDERMGKIFKPKGNTPSLNQYQAQLENIKEKIQELIEEHGQFDELSIELANSKNDFEQVKAIRNEKQSELLQVERKINVWNQWNEWRTYKSRLERLEPISTTFPEDAINRWQMANNNLENAQRSMTIEDEKRKRLEKEISEININTVILNSIPEINSLSECKSSYRSALLSMPTQEDALARSQEELTRLLTTLGPDWTCERITETDRSLFAKEKIERQAEEMSAAKSSFNNALDTVNKSQRTLDKTKDELAHSKDTLEKLPQPTINLTNPEREILRQSLEHITETMQTMPEFGQAAKASKISLDRACENLNISTTDVHKSIQILSDSQNIALSIASDFNVATTADNKIQENITLIQKEEVALKSRIENKYKQLLYKHILTRAELNERTSAIHSLRSLCTTFAHKLEKIEDLKDRRNELVPPVPVKNMGLISFGIIFSLIGMFVLLLNLPLPIPFADIAMLQGLKTPISIWLAIPIILAGISCLAGGLPRTGNEMQRHEEMMQQLNTKINFSEDELNALNAQIANLCALAKVSDPDPINLDATEMLLQNERELGVTQEKLKQDISDLQEECDLCNEKIKELGYEQAETNAEVQKMRHAWHKLMTDCGLENIPDANSAEIFFERVESAKNHSETFLNLELKISELDSQLENAKNDLFTIEAISNMVFVDDQLDVILDAIKTVIDACNETDLSSIEYGKTYAFFENAKTNYDKALTQYEEDLLTSEFAQKRVQVSQSQWQENLLALGIPSNLSPQTIRDALDKMEHCLNIEAEQKRIQNTIHNLNLEINPFIEHIKSILHALNYDNIPSSQDDEDWVAILDSLMDQANLMKELDQVHKNLNDKLQEQQYNVDNANVALNSSQNNIEKLLDMGEVSNNEDFLRKANMKIQKDDYKKHLEILEDSLNLTTDNIPLDEFMKSFENMDEYQIKQYEKNLQSELENEENKEQRLATEIATLSARIDTLESTELLSELRQQESSLEENIHLSAVEWCKYAIARQLLHNAKLHFEKERQPQVIKKASNIFNQITGNEWTNIIASLEDSSLKVIPNDMEKSGMPVMPSHLSRGAQEQLYLALRIAYIRNHSTHASPLPVIMDDILVNFDAGRAKKTAQAFFDLTNSSQKNQILFFTCHPYMADMLQDVIPSSDLLIVKNGKILQQKTA